MDNQKTHNYDILKTYTIDEIKALGDAESFIDDEIAEGRKIKLRRAKIYHKLGCECIEPGCQLRNFHYAVGLDKGTGIHLDLYAYDQDDELVMMTVDHIKPKSKGGRNVIENYQPMCMPHNKVKSNKHNFKRKFI